MALSVLGALLFFSVFVTGCMNFGRFDDPVGRSTLTITPNGGLPRQITSGNFRSFDDRARSEFGRALIGFGMLAVGGFMMKAGSLGLAGSGIKLDPEEARKDVEPWARMGGGVLKDALDEAGINPGGKTPASEQLPFDERLRRLQKLRQDGVLSEEEYEATKKKILEQA
jgi:hypothetical protein